MTPTRPRILIDAVAFSPQDGGFTTALLDLLNTCRRLPEFDFVIVHDRRYASVFRAFGLATYPVRTPKRFRFFASLALLPLVARRLKATAVHCEISALPWFLGIPGSVTVHDLYFMIDRESGVGTLRQRVMRAYWERLFVASIRRARIVKAISATTAADLRREINADLPMAVLGPRFEARGEVRTRISPSRDEELRLVFLGNVIPRKNLPFLLQSLRLVRRPWRLDIIGNLWWRGSELAVTQDPRIHVHGYLADAERDRLLEEAHLLVSPSHYEGFGYPAAEAMVRGLPAFASDVGAAREFVPAEWRFPLGDPAVLAEMIDSIDMDAYPEMQRRAREAMRGIGPQAHIEGHRRLFAELASGTRGLTDTGASESTPR